MSKALILFYSFEGDVRMVAEYLSKELDIPYEEVKPVKDISPQSFGKYYKAGLQVSNKETPELNPMTVNLDEYDTIFIGSPIWSGSFPPAIRTLLQKPEMHDKNIAYFYTHEGNLGKSEEKIEEEVNKKNNFVSLYGLYKVEKDFDNLKDGFINWARNIPK